MKKKIVYCILLFLGLFLIGLIVKKALRNYYFYQAEIYYKKGDSRKALKIIQEGRWFGADLEGYLLIASIQEKLGNYEKAVEIYSFVTQYSPVHVDIYKKLGELYLKLKEYKKAMLNFEKAISLTPQNIMLYGGVIEALNKMERNEDVIVYSKKVIELFPDDYRGYYSLGLKYREQGQYEQAELEFKEALARKNDSVMINNALAVIYMLKNDYIQAIEQFKETIKLEKNESMASCLLAVLNEKIGEHETAMGYLEKAFEQKNGELVEFWERVWEAYATYGNKNLYEAYMLIKEEGTKMVNGRIVK